MPSQTQALTSCRSQACRLGVLAAAGLISSLPSTAQANPATNVADCLRPSAQVAAAASPVFVPPGSGSSQLLAQALPASSGPRMRAPGLSRQPLNSNPQLAQATAPQSLPACTYDPPLPSTSPVIRGLW